MFGTILKIAEGVVPLIICFLVDSGQIGHAFANPFAVRSRIEHSSVPEIANRKFLIAFYSGTKAMYAEDNQQQLMSV
ncbi:Hypothetical protein NTJ_09346 [Nesidiocoris tenuis]|uniref:Uncharacterized protein n=1 Tax=Nesidiocoris tenuis TaxID=355587 RepID=A0ABN7AWG6_9HEMI|nr:Hypothetical protein NTJ_09346 [Nesidiocoris tenuis]